VDLAEAEGAALPMDVGGMEDARQVVAIN